MITSAKQIVRFTPRDLCDEDGRPLPDAPVYLIEPPTLFTRAEWHRAMFDIGARQVTVTDLLATMRRGIREVVAEDQREELLAFIQQFEDSSQGLDELSENTRQIIDQHGEDSDEGKEATAALMEALASQADMTGRMDDLEGQMRRMFPPYGRKIGEQLFWLENAPLVSARMFLTGAENTGVDVDRKHGMLPRETLDLLPAGHPREIGLHAIRLMNMIGADVKNSARPSSSVASRKRSARK